MPESRGGLRTRHCPLCPLLIIALASVGFSGCKGTGERDPLRPMNRVFFGMNMTFDRYIATPISNGYTTVVAKPIRRGIANFFGNLSELPIIAYDILQLRFGYALVDTSRILLNLTVGFAGFLDTATEMGIPKREQSFAITAAVWGIPPGPYLVLPFLGPMTLSSVPDIPVRIALSPITYLDPASVRVSATGARAVDSEAEKTDARDRVRESVDPYEFVRSAFLQKQADSIRRAKAKRKGVEEPPYPFEELPEDMEEPDQSEDSNQPALPGADTPPGPSPRPK